MPIRDYRDCLPAVTTPLELQVTVYRFSKLMARSSLKKETAEISGLACLISIIFRPNFGTGALDD
jgi:hypothetical protein